MEQRGRQPKKQELLPAVRRGRYETITIFEITEDELEQLQKGSPDSLLLNFAVFALSTFVSFLIALTTTTIQSNRLFDVFVIVACVSCFGALVLFSLWWRSRRGTSGLVQAIRRRLPPEVGVQEVELPPSAPSGSDVESGGA
jgi:hypothetical protein